MKKTNGPRTRRAITAAALMVASAAGVARAQLSPDQVLVIYDSRVQDSRAVAEFYAGSAQVPGGAGGVLGARPGVRAVDIASLTSTAVGGGPAGVTPCPTPPCAATPDINFTTFVNQFRNPIRNYLTSTNLHRRVRCLVMTKGLPHRLQDSDNAGVGDAPASAATELNNGDATYASVDAELTLALLLTPLETGENGNAGDSKSDGLVLNPQWRANLPITAWRTFFNRSAKTISGSAQIWTGATGGTANALNPGDLLLVCRLDGLTLADVQNSITRAQNIVLDDSAAGPVFILDEGGDDGVQDNSDTDQEFDNDGAALVTYGGDDYEQSRDLLLSDARVPSANVRYDFVAGAGGFFVGPRINFGGGVVISQNAMLLATLGNNHNGGVPGLGAGNAYGESFFYAPGAAFNSIESFNGRAFGGLTTLIGQEQVSEFLRGGGTFGIGNVYEPFSFSVADNLQIVRNFYLGNMTWAEAAYSAIPGLSWQQIVIGDPLARVRRQREDVNNDGRVNTDDLYAFFEVTSPPDFNRDGSVTSADLAILERSVRGAENAALNQTPSGKQQD